MKLPSCASIATAGRRLALIPVPFFPKPDSAAKRRAEISTRPDDILLVRDNPDDAELTIAASDRHHLAKHVVVVAGDGQEALELLLGEHAQPFAFLMLDLKLPEISGHEVLDRM